MFALSYEISILESSQIKKNQVTSGTEARPFESVIETQPPKPVTETRPSESITETRPSVTEARPSESVTETQPFNHEDSEALTDDDISGDDLYINLSIPRPARKRRHPSNHEDLQSRRAIANEDDPPIDDDSFYEPSLRTTSTRPARKRRQPSLFNGLVPWDSRIIQQCEEWTKR